MEKNEFKTCFIITPIGNELSDTRRQADGVVKSVLRPLLTVEFSFSEVNVAHEISKTGSINNQVMSGILDSDLVIANLTGLNPNVMYELAVRHATKKPVIHICEKGSTILPFDIADQRTVFYENDMLGVEELTNNLKKSINSLIDNSDCSDNPIYNARKQLSIYKELEKEGETGDVNRFIIEKLNSLEHKLSMSSYSQKYNNSYDVEASFLFKSVEANSKNLIIQAIKNAYSEVIGFIPKISTSIKTEDNDSHYRVKIFGIPNISNNTLQLILNNMLGNLPKGVELVEAIQAM